MGKTVLILFIAMAGWFQASGEVTADPLSEGQCREDPVATRSLDYAIHCRLSGWDDYVSCADPEAAPDRCDPDDKISREIRRALAFPQQKKTEEGWRARGGMNPPALHGWAHLAAEGVIQQDLGAD